MITTNGGSKTKTEAPVAEAIQSIAVKVNVASQESVRELVQKTVDAFGRIDILVNNAGIVRDAQLIKMTEENFDLVIDINLKGVFNCSQLVAPVMIENKVMG